MLLLAQNQRNPVWHLLNNSGLLCNNNTPITWSNSFNSITKQHQQPIKHQQTAINRLHVNIKYDIQTKNYKARFMAIKRTFDLFSGKELTWLKVPVGVKVLGCVINILGDPHEQTLTGEIELRSKSANLSRCTCCTR